MWTRVLAILAAIVAIVVASFYFSRSVAVVAPARPGEARSAVPGSVTVIAEPRIPLKSEIAGRVIRSEMDPGRVVKKGDFLVAVDPGDLELEIQRIESDLDAQRRRVSIGSSLKIELENLRDELANVERLAQLGSRSPAEVTRQQRIVRQMEQRVALEEVENKNKRDQLENILAVKRRQLAKMTIVAPFDGVISVVYANPGTVIDASAIIAEFISTSRTVEARISEENFSNLRVGQTASVRFLGYGSETFSAKVSKVFPTADAETQRYVVHLSVDIPTERLVPGLTGEVSIIVGQRAAKTLIPRRALRGSEVLVVKGGRIERRQVQVGFVALNQVEITSGLAVDELVVVENLDLFKVGDRVRTQAARAGS